MKKYLTIVALAFSLASYAQIENLPVKNLKVGASCDGILNAVSSVSMGGQRTTTTIFNHNGGTFDGNPLMSGSVTASESGCIVVHFSANVYVADNSVVFQVRMDGKPMEGHITAVLPAVGNSSQPVIIVPDEDGHSTKAIRPVSYTFFAKSTPGKHKIDVLVAACCSANTTGNPVVVADNATLVIQYSK